jgi:hypothetical protein
MSNKSYKRRSFWVGLYVFAALFIGLGFVQAQACVVVQEPCDGCERPDWWDTADAQVTFPSWTLGMWKGGGGTAAGEKDYSFSYSTYENPDGKFISVNLENEQALPIKQIWVAFHVKEGVSVEGFEPTIQITGHYNNQDPEVLFNDVSDITVSGNWFCLETLMTPQPAFENFIIRIGDDYRLADYLELGTKGAVPIPSTVLLLGAGFAGLVGFRKRRAKKS